VSAGQVKAPADANKPEVKEAVAADFMSAAPKIKSVFCEGLGKTVYLRAMSAAEKDDWFFQIAEAAKRKEEYTNMTAKLLVRCLCDGGGNLLFKPTDADALGKADAAILSALFEEASELCGLTTKAIEGAAKN